MIEDNLDTDGDAFVIWHMDGGIVVRLRLKEDGNHPGSVTIQTKISTTISSSKVTARSP